VSARFRDSTNVPIAVGDYVLHRGDIFTISTFMPGCGRVPEIAAVVLDRGEGDGVLVHGDEWSVDRVEVVLTEPYRGSRFWCLADGRYVARLLLPYMRMIKIGLGAKPEARAWLDERFSKLPLDLQPPEEP